MYHPLGRFLLEVIVNVVIGLKKKSATVLNCLLICLTLNLNLERDSDHFASYESGIFPTFHLSGFWRYL